MFQFVGCATAFPRDRMAHRTQLDARICEGKIYPHKKTFAQKEGLSRNHATRGGTILKPRDAVRIAPETTQREVLCLGNSYKSP